MSAKYQYHLAQHAMRYLKRYGNTITGHTYFLIRLRFVRVDILDKAFKGL